MDVWNAINKDSVYCKNEEDNEFDIMAVALIRDDCFRQNVVRHVQIHSSRTFYCFFKLPAWSISAIATSKRVNCGAGGGLEIPVEYRFFEYKKTVIWVKMQIEKIENNVNDKVNKFMK